MTQDERDTLARAIVAELRDTHNLCPLGLTAEDVETLREWLRVIRGGKEAVALGVRAVIVTAFLSIAGLLVYGVRVALRHWLFSSAPGSGS